MRSVKLIKSEYATAENFAPYGLVLEKPKSNPDICNENHSYWHKIYGFSGLQKNAILSYFICKRTPILCNNMEKILTNDEIYINIGGGRYILFLALEKDLNVIDEGSIAAFVFNGGQSALVKKGVWHLAPFPLDGDNDFLLALGRDNLKETPSGMVVNEGTVILQELKQDYSIEEGC